MYEKLDIALGTHVLASARSSWTKDSNPTATSRRAVEIAHTSSATPTEVINMCAKKMDRRDCMRMQIFAAYTEIPKDHYCDCSAGEDRENSTETLRSRFSDGKMKYVISTIHGTRSVIGLALFILSALPALHVAVSRTRLQPSRTPLGAWKLLRLFSRDRLHGLPSFLPGLAHRH